MKRPPALVLDTSALAAVAFGEPAGGRLALLLEGALLHAPTLMPYELASVAWRKAVRNPAGAESILRALDLALSLDVHWVEINQRDAVQLALEEGITPYDAAYLVTALVTSGALVTLDQRLTTAARARGVPLYP